MPAPGHPVSHSLATGTDYKRRKASAGQEFPHRFVIQPVYAKLSIAGAENRNMPFQAISKIAVQIRAIVDIDAGNCDIRSGLQAQPGDQIVQLAMHFVTQRAFFPAVQRQGYHLSRVTPAALPCWLSSVCQVSVCP